MRYFRAKMAVSSPNAVAANAGLYALVPTGPVADGNQDFNQDRRSARVVLGATGARSGTKHASDMWVPELGLALTDEIGGPTGTMMEFEHGNITWTPRTGSKITWAHGSTPTAAPAAPATPTIDDNADDDSHTSTPQPGDATTDNDDADTRKSAG